MTQHHFTDEDLTAFLDGEAPVELSQSIEAALATDKALSDRLASLTIPMASLRDAFDSTLSQAPAPPPLPVATPTPERGWRGLITGVAGGLAAGIALALTVFPEPEPKEPGWLDVVANYQMLYTPETIALANAVVVPREEQMARLSDLSQVIGLDLSGLIDVNGLEFRRAQQLGFNGKPLIQIAYALPDGTPVALCILQSTRDAKDVTHKLRQGMASSDWRTGTHGILLIGSEDQTIIDALTPRIQSLI